MSATITRAGGSTSQGQIGREKSNGSRNARFNIVPQPNINTNNTFGWGTMLNLAFRDPLLFSRPI